MGEPLQTIHQPEQKPRVRLTPVGLVVFLVVVVVLWRQLSWSNEKRRSPKELTWDDVAYIDEHGELQVKEWRQQAIQQQIDEYDAAEQYALLAAKDGIYKCFLCKAGSCFLETGMVWKYGVTRKGMGGRYPGRRLLKENLNYVPEFRGTLQQCLIEEKRKIGAYPAHPDNKRRSPPDRLARPPGNKNDN